MSTVPDFSDVFCAQASSATFPRWRRVHGLPLFDLTLKTYEQYRFEIQCWNQVTKIPKKQRGIEILLSLTEGPKDEFGTRAFLSSRLAMEDMTAEDGYDKVLAKLDEHLRRDDTGRLWESFVNFDKFQRTKDMSVSEYISRFDILYHQLNKTGDAHRNLL